MPRPDMTRIEFSIRADDAEILARMAQSRGCSVAELVRRSLYQALEPLARAQHEREMKTAAEVDERRRIREWNDMTAGEKRATYNHVVSKLPNSTE